MNTLVSGVKTSGQISVEQFAQQLKCVFERLAWEGKGVLLAVVPVRVAFPFGCMPRSARVELSPPARSSVTVPVEFDAAGKPELSWSTKHPLQNTRYRLVWSW